MKEKSIKVCKVCFLIIKWISYLFKIIFQIIEFYFVIIITNILIVTNLTLTSSTIYHKFMVFLNIFPNLIFQYLSLKVLTVYYFELFQFSYINKENFIDILSPILLSSIGELEQKQKINEENENNALINKTESNEKNSNETTEKNENNKTLNDNNENNITNNEIQENNENDEIFNINDSQPFILQIENKLKNYLKFIVEHITKFKLSILITLVIYFFFVKNIPNEENMYIIFLLLIAFPLLKLINIYLLIAFPLELIENNCVTYFNSIAYALRSKNKEKNKIITLFAIFSFLFYLWNFPDKIKSKNLFFLILLFIILWSFSFVQIGPCTVYGVLNEKFKALKIFNIIFTIVLLIIDILLLVCIYKIHIMPDNDLNTVQTNINITGLFTGKRWKENAYHSSSNTSSSICYTKTHYLNFIQLAGLANAAYFEDEKNHEENIMNVFELSIFNITGNKFKMKNMTFLTNNTDYVTILQTDFDIYNKTPLTVLSIKGTSTLIDYWLDVEMFFSSFIFSSLRFLPLFTFENFLSYIFNKYATLPFNYLEDISLTKKYINNIDKNFIKLQNKTGYGFNERKYLFIGHSLGGGLAKYMAFKYKLQGIAFSGPGLTPLEINFINQNRNKSYEKYYKSSLIDIVPDYDIIPRFELSAGSFYRVLCEKGLKQCHQISRTLCMMGVMCNKESLTGDLCRGIFTEEEYKKDFIDIIHKRYHNYKKN